MLEKLSKLIDVKSIVTLTVIFTMVFIVVSGKPVDEKVFLLFSNITTAVATFYFTKKKVGE